MSEGSEIFTLLGSNKLASASWMLEEDMRLLGQRHGTSLLAAVTAVRAFVPNPTMQCEKGQVMPAHAVGYVVGDKPQGNTGIL